MFWGFWDSIPEMSGERLANLAEYIEIQESALRLLLSILLGYPIATVHQLLFQKLHPQYQHAFFAICGLCLCYFNFGNDCIHSILAVLMTYLLVLLLNDNPLEMAILNFLFHMSYLLVGYFFTQTDKYDIIWTMPHCVLVLRLIGFVFDVADGQKSPELLTKDQKQIALPIAPTLLELMAFSFFPASFLIGPQFPYKRYQRFIDGEFLEHTGAIKAGLQRCAVGFFFLAVVHYGKPMLPDSYFLTDEFRNKLITTKLFQVTLWGKVVLYKYVACWLLVEGALMCSGFTYNGTTADGVADWSGCSNVKIILFETATKMSHTVQSFNVNTNNWVALYVYKRLKFLDQKMISYIVALTFLALWHGFHSGYYVAFALEYASVTLEKQWDTIYVDSIIPKYGDVLNSGVVVRSVKFVLLRMYNVLFLAWSLIPFVFLSYDRYLIVYSAVYYYGFVMLAVSFLLLCGLKIGKLLMGGLERRED